MEVNIHPTWKKVMTDEFEKPYFEKLTNFVKSEYQTTRCFPPARQIFNAFDKCPFNEVKVVIIGQDPYHGLNQAHGLCFSVNDGIPFPPSLRNIFVEIDRELQIPIPPSGNLERWAKQGVLLLNSILTVREGEAGSHQNKGWETFTDAVIAKISEEKSNVVFLLWGGYAKKKVSKVVKNGHCILESGHPSPLSANQGKWFGNNHFVLTNEFLKSKNLPEIDW